MDKQEHLRAKRETLLVALLLVLGSIFIVYPFMDAIVLAAAVAYLLAFGHSKLNNYIQNNTLSTTIIISGLLSMISVSLYFFIENIFTIIDRVNIFVQTIEDQIIASLDPLDLPSYFIDSISDFFNQASAWATDILLNIFTTLPYFLIQVGIFLVTAIYLYKDRKKIYSGITSVIEGLPETEQRIINSLIDSVDSIFRGVFLTQLIVAGIMGIAAAIGFYIIGLVTSPIPLIPVWALLIAVFAILPIIAAFMVYAPLGAYYIVAAEPLKGGLIIMYGIVVLQILPETLFRPYVGAKKLNEHPLIIFIGFIAGPLVLGVKGIVLGPLMLILTKQFILNYTDLVSSQD